MADYPTPASVLKDDGSTFDVSSKKRGDLPVDRVRELVAPILSSPEVASKITKIVLSTWGLSEASALVFATAIDCMENLRVAVLSDTIAGRPEAEGLAVYRALGASLQKRHLVELDLSDNAVGPKGLDACRELLLSQTAHLERLYFRNCGMSAEACRTVADFFLGPVPPEAAGGGGAESAASISNSNTTSTSSSSVRGTTKLTSLQFSNNMSGCEGAKALSDLIAHSPALEEFRFTSSRGRKEGGLALVTALMAETGPSSSLSRLDLHDNTFSADVGVPLAAWVRWSRAKMGGKGGIFSLTHLNIGDISLKDEGFRLFAEALLEGEGEAAAAAGGGTTTGENTSSSSSSSSSSASTTSTAASTGSASLLPKLQSLDISANDLTSKTLPLLLRLLECLPQLKELNLALNEVEDAGAKSLSHLYFKKGSTIPTLQTLNLSGTAITDEGAIAITYLASEQHKAAAAAMIGSEATAAAPHSSKTLIHLTENEQISKACIKRIQEQATTTPSLTILLPEEDFADEEGEEGTLDALMEDLAKLAI